MKDSRTDQSLQTVVIAQDIEEIFPELVKTDKDGMKSVNYTSFIPNLIESVKVLKEENERLRVSVKRFESMEASIRKLIEANKSFANQLEKSSK